MNLLLSNRFPMTHSRAGEPTNFEKSLLNHTKIHTIRENYKWWKLKAEKINAGAMMLSLRQWMGRPYHTDQKNILDLKKIGIQQIYMEYDRENSRIVTCIIDGKPYDDLKQVASHDGLSLADFTEWFFGNRKENNFSGVIIHFTDFRY